MDLLEKDVFESNKLNYLVHYYSDKNYLFKTIMMYPKDNLNKISDNIVNNKNWYWVRYRDTDREIYYKRRSFVENIMKKEFEDNFYRLSGDIPVYFYIIPGINKEIALNNCKNRIDNDEKNKVLLININEIVNNKNVTFTINDSFTCYLKKSIEAGVDCSKSNYKGEILDDHNKIFPIIDLIKINEKYKNKEINYEVQIWDTNLLERIKTNKNNYIN